MKILFVYPNFNDPFYPNLGLTNLATYLNECTSHSAEILDLTLHKREWPRLVRETLPRFDMVGFTSTMGTIINSLQVARVVKKEAPELPVIIGGIYATCVNRELFEFPEIDFVCVGEGETTLHRFLDALEAGTSYDHIPGLWLRKGEEIIENGPSELISDLDALPFNDFDLWDAETFFGWVNHLPIMGARGCQYSCSFCTQSTLHELYDKPTNFGYYRCRSPANIIEEIEYQVAKYQPVKPLKGVIFFDDTFTSNRTFVETFCDEYIARGLHTRIHWAINARMENLDKRLLLKLKRAGCYYLYFGIESESKATREFYRKRFGKRKVFNIVAYCKKLGFRIKTYFIIDGPKETVRDNLRTLKLARKLAPDTFHIMPFIPIPNTYAAEVFANTNPKRFRYLMALFSPKRPEVETDLTRVLISIVLGNMPESFLDLFKYMLMGLFSGQKTNQIYVYIMLKTMVEYFFASLKLGGLRFLADLRQFVKLNHEYSLVTSDLYALTLKKYYLERSFQ